jgi:hypothetical protein
MVSCILRLQQKIDVSLTEIVNHTDSNLLYVMMSCGLKDTVPCMNDYRQGLDWRLALLTTFNTCVMTTLNYSATTDLHTLQIITAHAMSF